MPEEMKQNKLFSVGEICKLCGLKPDFVYLQIRQGKLKAKRFGNRLVRVSQEALNQYLQQADEVPASNRKRQS